MDRHVEVPLWIRTDACMHLKHTNVVGVIVIVIVIHTLIVGVKEREVVEEVDIDGLLILRRRSIAQPVRGQPGNSRKDAETHSQ